MRKSSAVHRITIVLNHAGVFLFASAVCLIVFIAPSLLGLSKLLHDMDPEYTNPAIITVSIITPFISGIIGFFAALKVIQVGQKYITKRFGTLKSPAP